MLPLDPPWVEISSSADIPAGTGMGSSGSFTTALLKAIHTKRKSILHTDELAEQACHVEIDRLGEPIGKQDQYIAAFGGVTCFEFNQDDSVKAYPLQVSREVLYELEDNLVLFFTNTSRSASAILKDQNDRSKSKESDMLDNLHFIKELGLQTKTALENGNLAEFANLMNIHWQHKKKRSGGMSNPQIDAWYELGLKSGASGGKLIGAGGGGFLMFYCEEKTRLRHAMKQEGLTEVRFRFDYEGTKVLVS
jgi:D-glycero-alpha-D-manno-heptose-7-phosphate kinase